MEPAQSARTGSPKKSRMLPRSGRSQDLLLEIGKVALPARILDVAVDPVGLGGSHNDPITVPDMLPRDLPEVIQLTHVDLGLELHIHAPEPPAARQEKGEVAALLQRLPLANPPPSVEQPGEADEAVVPVMVAGNDEEISVARVAVRRGRLHPGSLP